MNNIANLVNAMQIKQDDVVLVQLWGEDEHISAMNEFCIEIAAMGASPIKLQHSRLFYKAVFEKADAETEPFGDAYFGIFEPVTYVIDLMAYRPAEPHVDFPKDKMEMYMKYMGELFQALTKKQTFVQLRLPTSDMADQFGIEHERFAKMLDLAYSVDYCALRQECESTLTKLNNVSELEVLTGENCTLKLSVADRAWHKDDGNGDYPSGEVYIAPIETSAQGKLFIKKLHFEGIVCDNIILEFTGGKLTTSNQDDFNAILSKLPNSANVLCEFGIGLNRQINELTGCNVFDEKAYGTCHIGIGNNTMFGGQNNAHYHTDLVFVGDVYADGVKIIENGKLV